MNQATVQPATGAPDIPAARPWKLALLWLAGLGPFFYLSYGLANYLAAQAAAHGQVPSVVFGWEHGIPFVPWTIYPYWSINAFYALSVFLAVNRQQLHRHGLRLLTAQIIAVTCFILWPLAFTFGAPAVEGAPALLFNALRGFDKPFNQAPSLHIALAVILWDWYRQFIHARWARGLLHGWTLLICVSVLSTYQHHFIDIPTGALLGVWCCWLWPVHGEKLPVQDMRQPTGKAIKLASLYGAGAVLCAAGAMRSTAWGLLWWWPALALLLVAANYAFLDARGFAMQPHGRMGWAARWLYAPYRVAAWINARLWTRGQALANEVLPGVWLGRLPSTSEWVAAGRPRIVSLCAELQAPHQADARCVPLLDLLPPTPDQLQQASRAIADMQKNVSHQAPPLWACCALGYSRSAAALATWLVDSGHCTNADEALACIRRVRPQVVLHTAHLHAVQQACAYAKPCQHLM
ncbi:MAG: phosphatase PAP2/dual specificity phosphatase family protein [Brachymonas sp.]|nr:phosphatase PAP2/dual specificity phosphatase family protein [Brachymonas sp.]